MANAVEAYRKAKQIKKGQRRVKQQQQEGTESKQGNCQRTKKGESSRLPKKEHLTGTLEPPSPATVPTIPYQGTDTGGEIGPRLDSNFSILTGPFQLATMASWDAIPCALSA